MAELHARRPGRPKQRLPEPENPLTARVRRLVDTAHAGNLSHASSLTGLSYPTLRDLYSGSKTTPGLRTLQSLADPYGLDQRWLLGEGDSGQIPVLGLSGLLPPAPSEKSRALREVVIPFRAWVMYSTFVDAERALNRMEPGRQRPIVAEATGDAFLFRLTTFLMQPLLSAEKLGFTDIIIASGGLASERQSAERDNLWTQRLDRLGLMWRSLLPWGPSERLNG